MHILSLIVAKHPVQGGSLSSITIFFLSCWFSHQVAEVVLLQEHPGAAGLEVDQLEE